ncbi:MAG: COX15/CtaA family protein [Alphaproteobacteria bacterium]|nr:COX15/CtaA family protein [Alphaproteobacteria bacterium]
MSLAVYGGVDEAVKFPSFSVCFAVRVWLICLLFLIIIMIAVGGATRLTDSGLSITEWQLLSGLIPPLGESAWREAFAAYQKIPEYQSVNQDMSLSEFRFIYWWEWGHRFLARFLAFVFIFPFIFFWVRGHLSHWLVLRLLAIFTLIAVQGGIGWYMVKSGLSVRVDVSQYRLALHLCMAFTIFGLLWWTWMGVSGWKGSRSFDGSMHFVAGILAGLLFFQCFLGALVAGLDAGMGYTSWPLMDESFIPGGLFVMQPWYLNLFENALTVQFDHRILAYLIWLLAVWFAFYAPAAEKKSATLLFFLVSVQLGLGVWTLLSGVSLLIALLHQIFALVVFAASLSHFSCFSAFPTQKSPHKRPKSEEKSGEA